VWPQIGNLSNDFLLVQIGKEKTAIDVVFTALVLVLAVLSSIIIGIAIDLTVVRSIVTRPIGPIICFLCQFTFIPLVSDLVLQTKYKFKSFLNFR
jgi:hypothetical protein